LIKRIFISGIVLLFIGLALTFLISQKIALIGPTTFGTYLIFVILSVAVGAYLTYKGLGMRKADQTQSRKRSWWRFPPFIPEPKWYDKSVHGDMDPYIENRVIPFVENQYYKANLQMSQFYLFEASVIIVSAIIPIINVVDPNYIGNYGSLIIRMVSAILGGTVAAIAGYVQLRKFQESAIVSRTFMAKLQKEYHSFFQNAGNYSDLDENMKKTTKEKEEEKERRKKKFVDTVESLMLDATTSYYELHQRGQKQEGTPPLPPPATPQTQDRKATTNSQ
jgi:hypothetical protein